jgi:hypothetical protein
MHKLLFFKSGVKTLLIQRNQEPFNSSYVFNFFFNPSYSAYVSYCFKMRGAYLSYSSNLSFFLTEKPNFFRPIYPFQEKESLTLLERGAQTLLMRPIFPKYFCSTLLFLGRSPYPSYLSVFWDLIPGISYSPYVSCFLREEHSTDPSYKPIHFLNGLIFPIFKIKSSTLSDFFFL